MTLSVNELGLKVVYIQKIAGMSFDTPAIELSSPFIENLGFDNKFPPHGVPSIKYENVT